MKPVEYFFAKTAAFRAVTGDKKAGKLSHSYLLLCRDEAWARDYLKALAKLIMCEKGGCGECRACKLIDREVYADCEIYPREGEKITAEGIDIIVSEKCYVKPLESSIRVFAVAGAEKMNVPAQNKLLKTLEEPPANVCIILSANGDHSLLPTVKSRVKRLEIPLFPSGEIYSAFEGRFADKEKLKTVCELCDGRPGDVESLYACDAVSTAVGECVSLLVNIKKSRDIAYYSGKLIKKTRDEFAAFISAMRVVVRDALFIQEGMENSVINSAKKEELEEIALKYRQGALLSFAEALKDAAAATEGYANQTMLADKILFTLLEENYRWQKL
ncbi:MAG: hypothetical protein J6Z34_04390 [Clostridia bacterium]|nr:hypothetical protein [Clostridia bacterium]